jgi:protein TonB
MGAATTSRYGEQSPRRRAISIGLTIGAHLLLAWLLLHLGPSWTKPSDEPPLSTFDVTPPPGRVSAPATPDRAVTKRASAGGARAAPVRVTKTLIPKPVPAPENNANGQSLMALDFDLGTVPRRGTGEGSADGAGKGDSVAAYGPGAGPGGERLYNAEWQREPRPAELGGYLPGSVASGSWAMIACRTIPDNQVENCRALGEGPVGSGLARAMRQAAWQFRILPPRIGGKPIIGAWVRIRFDWTAGELRTR